MQTFDIISAIKSFSSIGVFTDVEVQKVLSQQSYVREAFERWVVTRVTPTKSEVALFLYQCCKYLLESESYRFKQAFADWNTTGEFSQQDFYAMAWNANVLIGVGEDLEPVVCSRRQIYDVCASAEYLGRPEHASAGELIDHTATKEQVKIFANALKSGERYGYSDDAITFGETFQQDGTTELYSLIPEAKILISDTGCSERHVFVTMAVAAAKDGKLRFQVASIKNEESSPIAALIKSVGYSVVCSDGGMFAEFPDTRCIHSCVNETEDDLCKQISDLSPNEDNFFQALAELANTMFARKKHAILQEAISKVTASLQQLALVGSIQLPIRTGYERCYKELSEILGKKGYSVECYCNYIKIVLRGYNSAKEFS